MSKEILICYGQVREGYKVDSHVGARQNLELAV